MNSNQLTALAPIITLTIATIAVMLTIAIRRNFVLASTVTAGGILISLLALGIAWQQSPIQATLLIRVDDYALFFMALLLLAGLAVLGFCYDYFKEREGENEELLVAIANCTPGCFSAGRQQSFCGLFFGS